MRLSIISINKNNANGLEKTINSILIQSCKDFEYIIVDGNSTDGSCNIVDKYKTLLSSTVPFIYISEEDTGIYQAMNKGIRLSHGEYLLFLNSGDFLCDINVTSDVLPILNGSDIIQGNTIESREGQEYVNRGYGRSDISMLDVFNGHFLHQASFIKSSLFQLYGFYDESYKINGDTVFYAKVLGLGNATFMYHDRNIAYFDTHGISSKTQIEWSQIREEEDNRYVHETYSQRIRNLIEVSRKSINLYECLHNNSFIWKCTLILKKISQLPCFSKTIT